VYIFIMMSCNYSANLGIWWERTLFSIKSRSAPKGGEAKTSPTYK
jgi:hypothetical protein